MLRPKIAFVILDSQMFLADIDYALHLGAMFIKICKQVELRDEACSTSTHLLETPGKLCPPSSKK